MAGGAWARPRALPPDQPVSQLGVAASSERHAHTVCHAESTLSAAGDHTRTARLGAAARAGGKSRARPSGFAAALACVILLDVKKKVSSSRPDRKLDPRVAPPTSTACKKEKKSKFQGCIKARQGCIKDAASTGRTPESATADLPGSDAGCAAKRRCWAMQAAGWRGLLPG